MSVDMVYVYHYDLVLDPAGASWSRDDHCIVYEDSM